MATPGFLFGLDPLGGGSGAPSAPAPDPAVAPALPQVLPDSLVALLQQHAGAEPQPGLLDRAHAATAPEPPAQNGPDFTLAPPDLVALPPPDANPPVGPISSPQDGADRVIGMLSQRGPQPTAAPLQARAPSMGEAYRQQQDAARIGIDAITDATRVEVARADDRARILGEAQPMLAQIAEQQRAANERAQQVLLGKQQAAKALATEADSYRVDFGRYWKQGSTARNVGWLISMALSGLGDALNGGRSNSIGTVSQMLRDTIDRDVRSQIDERNQLQRRAGAAAADVDKWSRFSSSIDAQYHARMAQAQQLVARQIEAAAAKYGSQDAIARGQAASAELLKRAAADAVTAADKAADHELRRDQQSIARANVGLGYAQLGETRRHNRVSEQLTQQARELEAAKLLKEGKNDEAKLIRERGISGAPSVVKDADGKPVIGPDGKPVVSYGLLRNRDGSAWIPQGGEASIDKLRQKKAGADDIIATLDQVLALGPEWLSDTANSEKLQRLRTLWGSAKMAGKNYLELGVIAGPDERLIGEFLGTEDPTAFRSKIAGLKQARENIIRGVNLSLRSAGYDGEYAPDDLSRYAGAAAQPDDTEQQRVLADPWRDVSGQQFASELGLDTRGGRNPSPSEVTAAWNRVGGMLPSQRATLDSLYQMATGRDAAARERGLSVLENASRTASLPAVRDYATQLLANTLAAGEVSRTTPEQIIEANRVGRAAVKEARQLEAQRAKERE